MCNGGACGCGNGQQSSGGCSCGHNRMAHWVYKLVFVLLVMAVLGIVFCTGFKLGLLASHTRMWVERPQTRDTMIYMRDGMMDKEQPIMAQPDATNPELQ